MPLHFLFRPAETPSASLPPSPDAAADRLPHKSTVDPLCSALSGSHHATLPSHQNTICPDATRTPLPNTAPSCPPRRRHTSIWPIIPFDRAQLFYPHSPSSSLALGDDAAFVLCQQPRLEPWHVNVCHAVVPSRRLALLVPCIGGPGTPAACTHCTDRAVDRLLGLDVDRHGMFEGDAESRQTDRSRVPLTVCLRYSKVYPPSSLPDEREIVTSDCG
jgi:hypothetical protein